MSLPQLTGVGRLTDDPELRFLANGAAVCKVRLAFNSRKKDQATGEWVDGDVYYVDGTVWKQEAENVAESLSRGVEVAVTGRLKTRQFETREGEKRSAVELMIDSIAPSLKFATAKVQKMSRSSGNNAPAAGGGEADPWSTAAPATGGSRAGLSSDDPPPF